MTLDVCVLVFAAQEWKLKLPRLNSDGDGRIPWLQEKIAEAEKAVGGTANATAKGGIGMSEFQWAPTNLRTGWHK